MAEPRRRQPMTTVTPHRARDPGSCRCSRPRSPTRSRGRRPVVAAGAHRGPDAGRSAEAARSGGSGDAPISTCWWDPRVDRARARRPSGGALPGEHLPPPRRTRLRRPNLLGWRRCRRRSSSPTHNPVLTYNVTVLAVVWLTALCARSPWSARGRQPARAFRRRRLSRSARSSRARSSRLHVSAVHFFPLVLLLAWRVASRPRPGTAGVSDRDGAADARRDLRRVRARGPARRVRAGPLVGGRAATGAACWCRSRRSPSAARRSRRWHRRICGACQGTLPISRKRSQHVATTSPTPQLVASWLTTETDGVRTRTRGVRAGSRHGAACTCGSAAARNCGRARVAEQRHLAAARSGDGAAERVRDPDARRPGVRRDALAVALRGDPLLTITVLAGPARADRRRAGRALGVRGRQLNDRRLRGPRSPSSSFARRRCRCSHRSCRCSSTASRTRRTPGSRSSRSADPCSTCRC